MVKEIIEKTCPTCHHTRKIKVLVCDGCGTDIERHNKHGRDPQYCDPCLAKHVRRAREKHNEARRRKNVKKRSGRQVQA